MPDYEDYEAAGRKMCRNFKEQFPDVVTQTNAKHGFMLGISNGMREMADLPALKLTKIMDNLLDMFGRVNGMRDLDSEDAKRAYKAFIDAEHNRLAPAAKPRVPSFEVEVVKHVVKPGVGPVTPAKKVKVEDAVSASPASGKVTKQWLDSTGYKFSKPTEGDGSPVRHSGAKRTRDEGEEEESSAKPSAAKGGSKKIKTPKFE